jgi:hypothetical protein
MIVLPAVTRIEEKIEARILCCGSRLAGLGSAGQDRRQGGQCYDSSLHQNAPYRASQWLASLKCNRSIDEALWTA